MLGSSAEALGQQLHTQNGKDTKTSCATCQGLTSHLLETKKRWSLMRQGEQVKTLEKNEGARASGFQRKLLLVVGGAQSQARGGPGPEPGWAEGGGPCLTHRQHFLPRAPALSLGSPCAAHPAGAQEQQASEALVLWAAGGFWEVMRPLPAPLFACCSRSSWSWERKVFTI